MTYLDPELTNGRASAPLLGHKFPAGCGFSTVIADMDFETYSEAGLRWDEATKKWKMLPGASKRSISAVGAVAYAEHPSTEVICLAYDLKDGVGPRLWVPGFQPPRDLFDYLARGGIIEAFNSAFEYHIWLNVCHKRMGWPELPAEQLRCAQGKAYHFSLQSNLNLCATVLGVENKNDDGKKLISKFCQPRNPTKKDPRKRHHLRDFPEEAGRFYSYCLQDINVEAQVSAKCPDLSPEETEVFILGEKTNFRGCPIDTDSVANLMDIVKQGFDKYDAECRELTGGISASQLEALKGWLAAVGIGGITSLTKDTLPEIQKRPDVIANQTVSRVLAIRALIGSASIKKLFNIDRHISIDGALKDLFQFAGASRTGRYAGRGAQPQNLPNSGPDVYACACGAFHTKAVCPACGRVPTGKKDEWSFQAAEFVLHIATARSLSLLESYIDDPFGAMGGCLRGLFCSRPGNDLICSDYSAIEAVVQAMICDEKWRVDVFRTHGKIYEMSASKITGVPLEEYLEFKKKNGFHHPDRKKGKVAELASGYGGWLDAWYNFGASDFMDDQEIKKSIIAWRAASPNIVETWGGQVRKHPHRWEFKHELFGLEGAVVQAIQNPGHMFGPVGMCYYGVKDDKLFCRLPSGRLITYFNPELHRGIDNFSKETIHKISYKGWDSNVNKWIRIRTHGGKLFENIVQAISRDILVYAMVNLDKAGYPPVLHVHDEIVCHVPTGYGSVEEFERIMGTLPPWCADWPIKAAGGWRGHRYRKD